MQTSELKAYVESKGYVWIEEHIERVERAIGRSCFDNDERRKNFIENYKMKIAAEMARQ